MECRSSQSGLLVNWQLASWPELATSDLYRLTLTYQIASLPLQQRGPLLRIHAPAAFGRPVHQKDR
jgi:hypothetical protein